MRIFLSKQYEDTLDSKVIEVLEKFQIFEERKDAKKRACSVPRNILYKPLPPFMFIVNRILRIFDNGEL